MMQGGHRAQQFKCLMNETPNVNLLIRNYQLSNWLGYKYKVNLLEFVMIITNNCENEKKEDMNCSFNNILDVVKKPL
jgi:hypothetical protein